MIRFFVYIALILLILAGAISLEGGALTGYIGITPIMVVILIPVFSIFAVWGFGGIGRAFSFALGKHPDMKNKEEAVNIWNFFEKINYAAGILTFLLGLVIIFNNFRNNDLTKIGAPLAVGLLGIIYCLFLGVISRILIARCEER